MGYGLWVMCARRVRHGHVEQAAWLLGFQRLTDFKFVARPRVRILIDILFVCYIYMLWNSIFEYTYNLNLVTIKNSKRRKFLQR